VDKVRKPTRKIDGEDVFGTSIGIAFAVGLCIFGWEFYTWLKFGAWPDNKLINWINAFNIDPTPIFDIQWLGILKIILWFLELPIIIILPGFIFVCGWIIKVVTSEE
jgi:hypothetical protein